MRDDPRLPPVVFTWSERDRSLADALDDVSGVEDELADLRDQCARQAATIAFLKEQVQILEGLCCHMIEVLDEEDSLRQHRADRRPTGRRADQIRH